MYFKTADYFLSMANDKKTFFGDRLKTLRLEKGLTQTELGKRVGLSRRMIVHYEKHATRPPADKVMALAQVLGLEVRELIKINNIAGIPRTDPLFARKLEKAKRLPLQDREVLVGIIDSFLQKNGLTQKRKKTAKA